MCPPQWLVGVGVVVFLASLFSQATLGLGGEAGAASEKVVIATVGGAEITLEDLDRFIEQLPQNIRNYARSHKAEMLESLIDRRLMLRYAEAAGLDQSERVRREIAQARREMLIREAVRVVAEKARPTQKEVRAEYENNKVDYRVGEKVTAAHIMVATEEEAKALLVDLKKGVNFGDLAKQRSLAPERERGGSLGTMERGAHKLTGLPAIIEETAFSLEADTYSGVVKSVYGWHVVYTAEKDEGRQLSFEEARAKIAEQLGNEKRKIALENVLKELAETYTVQSYPDRLR
ncbi:MAG: peptidyl-prolyl cis-trans isomerase [Candidatus Methylomirabilia bacterium]